MGHWSTFQLKISASANGRRVAGNGKAINQIANLLHGKADM
jgi:hypothetical protein